MRLWKRSNLGLNAFMNHKGSRVCAKYVDQFYAQAMRDYISIHRQFKPEEMVKFVECFYEVSRQQLLAAMVNSKVDREYRQIMLIALRETRDQMLKRISEAK